MGIFLADESSGTNAKSMHVDDLDCSKAHIYYIYQYSVYGLFCARYTCIINLNSQSNYMNYTEAYIPSSIEPASYGPLHPSKIIQTSK